MSVGGADDEGAPATRSSSRTPGVATPSARGPPLSGASKAVESESSVWERAIEVMIVLL